MMMITVRNVAQLVECSPVMPKVLSLRISPHKLGVVGILALVIPHFGEVKAGKKFKVILSYAVTLKSA